ncbi:MAG TPA: hypothetical protein VH105_04920 [Burkholderiales bacterium]|nr:hypothetical protein [Burkholderiales bacterium]
MLNLAGRLGRLAALIAAILLSPCAGAQSSNEKWEPLTSAPKAHTLRYSATATLLGKPTAVSLKFYCDTTRTKSETGATGFDLVIDKIATLAPFDFEAFEGPDAPAARRNLMKITVTRAGKPPLVINTSAAGWSPDGPNFAFGIAGESYKAASPARTLLRAIAEGADTLGISVTDAKNPKVKLELSIPVGQKTADFKALLADLK